jgi:hypothetical protein
MRVSEEKECIGWEFECECGQYANFDGTITDPDRNLWDKCPFCHKTIDGVPKFKGGNK